MGEFVNLELWKGGDFSDASVMQLVDHGSIHELSVPHSENQKMLKKKLESTYKYGQCLYLDMYYLVLEMGFNMYV